MGKEKSTNGQWPMSLRLIVNVCLPVNGLLLRQMARPSRSSCVIGERSKHIPQPLLRIFSVEFGASAAPFPDSPL
jgi:hypothetical protein